jgi:hypothetical protein
LGIPQASSNMGISFIIFFSGFGHLWTYGISRLYLNFGHICGGNLWTRVAEGSPQGAQAAMVAASWPFPAGLALWLAADALSLSFCIFF